MAAEDNNRDIFCKGDVTFQVNSPNVQYTEETVTSRYTYHTNNCTLKEGVLTVTPNETEFLFKTERNVPKVGIMLVGLGGNNGSTFVGSLIAHKNEIEWETKEGTMKPNWFGSITQSSTTKLGNLNGNPIYIPINQVVPMLCPQNIVVGGWDINQMNLKDAMKRAKVFKIDLQNKLGKHMEGITPLPGLYYPDFIASNQEDRADNVVPGSCASMAHVERIQQDIRNFKETNNLDKVIVLWTANTERYAEIIEGVNTTSEELMNSIQSGHAEVSPSTVYAVAAVREGCSYINGSPQNTFVPGLKQLAAEHGTFIAGDDFKSGQTKIKSVLADFLTNAGLKMESIVSYNHLGNNDGKNLNEQAQFRSKEISKSGVVDDMVYSNPILFPNMEEDHPDHCVVIKYVPFVGDSKRAMDEYTCRIFMGGLNTIAMHNTCEDSLLATPLILDLVILTELCERIKYQIPSQGIEDWSSFDTILSILSYLLKAPMVEENAPIVNALNAQRSCIENILKALIGIQGENHMGLEYKTQMTVKKTPSESEN